MPINGHLRAKLRQIDAPNTIPLVFADLLFSNVSISLDDWQYRNILSILDYITNFATYEKFRKMVPQCGFDTVENRKKWWLSAIRALRQDMENVQYFTWDQVMSRKMKRKEYIALYKRSKKLPWLDPLDDFDVEKLQMLENELDFETIVFFRELAFAEIAIEKQSNEV
jgi:hypothetical protein